MDVLSESPQVVLIYGVFWLLVLTSFVFDYMWTNAALKGSDLVVEDPKESETILRYKTEINELKEEIRRLENESSDEDDKNESSDESDSSSDYENQIANLKDRIKQLESEEQPLPREMGFQMVLVTALNELPVRQLQQIHAKLDLQEIDFSANKEQKVFATLRAIVRRMESREFDALTKFKLPVNCMSMLEAHRSTVEKELAFLHCIKALN